MPTVNNNSIRLLLLQNIVAAYKAVDVAVPTDDPYGVKFGTVGLGPIDLSEFRNKYACGVVPRKEVEKWRMPLIDCFLNVDLEFKTTINQGEAAILGSPGEQIERLMTVIKRVMQVDRTWGGIAIDTQIIGSETDLETWQDRSAAGVVSFEIHYRYSNEDVRSPLPNFGTSLPNP